jgi:hypothetical protein
MDMFPPQKGFVSTKFGSELPARLGQRGMGTTTTAEAVHLRVNNNSLICWPFCIYDERYCKQI